MAPMKSLSLLLIISFSFNVDARVARAEIESGLSISSSQDAHSFEFLRKPDVFVGTSPAPIHSRELYGAQWSWSNLLFHLGICKAENCHKGPGPCGCPDCSKPHRNNFQNGYCDSYDSSYTSDSSSSGGNSDNSRAFYDDGSTANGGPTATRSSYMWWIVGGVGVAAAAAGAAFVMRKRNAAGFAVKSRGAAAVANTNGGITSNYMLMGGVSAAIAGAMAKLGLKSHDDSSSTTSGSSGMVSKRMGLMEADELPRISDEASEAPSFVEVHSCHGGDETYLEAPDGMEVQGPYRPSSNYAV